MLPDQVMWTALTQWQSGALIDIDEDVDDTITYRYRLRVRRENGNATLAPTATVAGN